MNYLEKDISFLRNSINTALDELYLNNQYLFDNGLCERCIAHKFAIYLERKEVFNNYFVDCEYNRAYSSRNGGIGTKKVTSKDGNSIDIVITKRNDNPEDDYVCFEVKKWNNTRGVKGFNEDREKLEVLTGQKDANNAETGELLLDNYGEPYCFNYKFGFFIVFGPIREEVLVEEFIRDQ